MVFQIPPHSIPGNHCDQMELAFQVRVAFFYTTDNDNEALAILEV